MSGKDGWVVYASIDSIGCEGKVGIQADTISATDINLLHNVRISLTGCSCAGAWQFLSERLGKYQFNLQINIQLFCKIKIELYLLMSIGKSPPCSL